MCVGVVLLLLVFPQLVKEFEEMYWSEMRRKDREWLKEWGYRW
jgi:hypothetical protein